MNQPRDSRAVCEIIYATLKANGGTATRDQFLSALIGAGKRYNDSQWEAARRALRQVVKGESGGPLYASVRDETRFTRIHPDIQPSHDGAVNATAMVFWVIAQHEGGHCANTDLIKAMVGPGLPCKDSRAVHSAVDNARRRPENPLHEYRGRRGEHALEASDSTDLDDVVDFVKQHSTKRRMRSALEKKFVGVGKLLRTSHMLDGLLDAAREQSLLFRTKTRGEYSSAEMVTEPTADEKLLAHINSNGECRRSTMGRELVGNEPHHIFTTAPRYESSLERLFNTKRVFCYRPGYYTTATEDPRADEADPMEAVIEHARMSKGLVTRASFIRVFVGKGEECLYRSASSLDKDLERAVALERLSKAKEGYAFIEQVDPSVQLEKEIARARTTLLPRLTHREQGILARLLHEARELKREHNREHLRISRNSQILGTAFVLSEDDVAEGALVSAAQLQFLERLEGANAIAIGGTIENPKDRIITIDEAFALRLITFRPIDIETRTLIDTVGGVESAQEALQARVRILTERLAQAESDVATVAEYIETMDTTDGDEAQNDSLPNGQSSDGEAATLETH